MKDWFEGHEWSLFHDEPRKTIAPYWVLVLAILVGIAAALLSFHLHAAPKVNSQEECALVADMVLVAAAMEKNAVEIEKRPGVMADAYAPQLTGSEAKRWQEIVSGALRFAAKVESSSVEPIVLSAAVNQACNEHRGHLELIFGRAPDA